MAFIAPLIAVGASGAGAAGLITATTAAITAGAATAIGSFVSSSQAASEAKSQQKAYNKELLRTTIDKYQQLDKEEGKIIYDAHTKSIGAQKEFLITRARAEAQAAASGSAGQSVNLALDSLSGDLGNSISDITYEQEARLDQVNQAASDISSNYTSSYNNKKISSPSIFASLGKGVEAYSSTRSFVKQARADLTAAELAKEN